MRQVAALFVRQDSCYKTMPGVDCYDIERDARRWPGGVPGVFHPPCRAWGSLRNFAKPRPDEKDLARWAVRQVREWGGVLEHPAASTLWADQSLPEPGQRDRWGGWTLVIYQGWFGHLADKATRLYIVGCAPSEIPVMPIRLGDAPRVISPWRGLRAGMPGYRTQCTKAAREHTPPLLAEWLIELARRTRVPAREAMAA